MQKIMRHWIMFRGHHDDVDDEAEDNHKVEEGVGDHGVEPLPEPTPAGTADLGYTEATRHETKKTRWTRT